MQQGSWSWLRISRVKFIDLIELLQTCLTRLISISLRVWQHSPTPSFRSISAFVGLMMPSTWMDPILPISLSVKESWKKIKEMFSSDPRINFGEIQIISRVPRAIGLSEKTKTIHYASKTICFWKVKTGKWHVFLFRRTSQKDLLTM